MRFYPLGNGLGGRYDAIAICAPDLCILTSLGYEHQKQLGETLVEIAAEKGESSNRTSRLSRVSGSVSIASA